MAFSDVQIAYQGRGVMAKHKAYSMYRPTVVFLAQTFADMPILFVQITILDIIVYFMSGLQLDAGKFFTFLLFSFALTGAITAFFRAVGYAVGNYNDATKITGGVFTAFVVVGRIIEIELTLVLWLYLVPARHAPVALLDTLDQPDFLQYRGTAVKRARRYHIRLRTSTTCTLWSRVCGSSCWMCHHWCCARYDLCYRLGVP